MRTLGIETSCDDTGVAIYDTDKGLLAHQLASQIKTHQPHGGIVPELAARDHIRTLLPVIHHVINHPANAGKIPDRLGYTAGPGLASSLLVGAAVSKSLAFAWNIPAIEVHHMEGHLLAPMLEDNPPQFPFVALLVSGGHTLLVDVSKPGQYQIIGQSVDDAAGEAFDKTAKLLGLGYPGGPAIAQLAESGHEGAFHFPRPMTNRPGLDFSFSGLKTHTLTTVNQCIKDNQLNQQTKADIALAFEQAVVDTLAIKCLRALKQTNRNRLVISGGVGSNQRLRAKLQQMGQGSSRQQHKFDVFYPRPSLCTDNGAMIAYAAHFRFSLNKTRPDSTQFQIYPRWNLEQIDHPK